MTFLKKLGVILFEGLRIVSGIGPSVAQTFPATATDVSVVTSDLQQFLAAIASVEAIGAALKLPGDQKLAGSLPLIEQVILSSSMMVGHSIDNPDLFKKAVAGFAQATVDVANSLKANVDTIDKA